MFLTKYALSGGVGEIVGSCDGEYFKEDGRYGGFYRIGRDVFRTRKEAVADAEKRRLLKIASLRKQIQKLEKLQFN